MASLPRWLPRRAPYPLCPDLRQTEWTSLLTGAWWAWRLWIPARLFSTFPPLARPPK